jgi:hypothetical protein
MFIWRIIMFTKFVALLRYTILYTVFLLSFLTATILFAKYIKYIFTSDNLLQTNNHNTNNIK